MKNISQTQIVKVYKLLRLDGQPWMASVEVANGKYLNAEGKTRADALTALAKIWPEPQPAEHIPAPPQSYVSGDFAMLATVPPEKRAALEQMYATSHMAIPKKD